MLLLHVFMYSQFPMPLLSHRLLHRLNEQLRPILELLRETESLSLAPELLEPEPQSIANQVRLAQSRRGMAAKGGKELHTWTTRKT